MSRMRRGTRLIALALALGLAAPSIPAAADDARPTKANMEEAQRRFARGKELYDENDFQAALVEFRRAYDLAPNYRLLYNIAQVYYQLQDYPGALRTFNKYLADGQSEITAQRRDEVQKEIERLRTRVATLTITTNEPNAEIAVDDAPVGTAPLAEPVVVSVGKRKISASLPGHVPASKVVEVAGMDAVKVNLELVETRPGAGAPVKPDEPPKPVRPPPKASGFPWVPWAITGGLGVAAAVTGGLALRASSNLDDKLNTFGVTRGDLDSARSSTKTLALTTDILLGATVVGAGVSLVITLTRGPGKPDPKAAASRPEVYLGIGPSRVGLSGSF